DLEAVQRIVASAPRRVVGPPPTARRVGGVRMGVARGPAFDFVYPENLEQAGTVRSDHRSGGITVAGQRRDHTGVRSLVGSRNAAVASSPREISRRPRR